MGEGEQENFTEEIEDPVGEAHWPKVLFYTYLQLLMLYGIILIFTEGSLLTTLYTFLLIYVGYVGVTAGSHRLWAHSSYQACPGLKTFLMLCQTLVGQGPIDNWVLYHRLHHKYLNTEKDPFNPSKGFFHSHFFCLIQKPPSDQEELLKQIDASDLENDPVLRFQKRYYWLLFPIMVFICAYVPYSLWNESLLCAAFIPGFMRYGISLHVSWMIHSASTIFALKKGEKYPADTNLVFLWDKTYWLHYHYLTPWDYQTSEYGKYGDDQISAMIRVFAALELADSLRTIDTVAVQEALYMCLETKKPITECLSAHEGNKNLPTDHYLNPKKYY